MVRAGPHTFNAKQIRNGNRGLVIKTKEGLEIYPVFVYKKNSKSWTLVRGGPHAKTENRAMFIGLRKHLDNGNTPKERQDLYIQWYQGMEQTDPLYKGALEAASKMLSIAKEPETLKQVEGRIKNNDVFDNLSKLVKPKKTEEPAPKPEESIFRKMTDFIFGRSGEQYDTTEQIKKITQVIELLEGRQNPTVESKHQLDSFNSLGKSDKIKLISKLKILNVKFKDLADKGIATLKTSDLIFLNTAAEFGQDLMAFEGPTPNYVFQKKVEKAVKEDLSLEKKKVKGAALVGLGAGVMGASGAKALGLVRQQRAKERQIGEDRYDGSLPAGMKTGIAAVRQGLENLGAVGAAGAGIVAKQVTEVANRRLVNQPEDPILRGAGENTGAAPEARTDEQVREDDAEGLDITNLDTGKKQDPTTGEDIEPPVQPPVPPVQPPAPPIPTMTQATLDPTQQELRQRQQDLATDVKADTGAVIDEDNIPEIGIQQEGISAIAVKLGYDFTYYKDLVEKQSPPSKDDGKRAKELEICMKEYGAFIPIKQDNSYESVLEIYTLKYIYNEHLRFDRKWKMSLINNIRNISQQNMMPGSAAGTGTGLAVSLETMGISAEEAVKRLTSNSAAAAPQSGNTGQFRTSQTTGRLPFAPTGRTGERGQPIYNIPPKPGSENTTVPPLSRQVKADVEKTADKKPPVIPDEFKDFIMKWDTKKQKWVKMGRRPKPKQKQYKPNNIQLKIEKPMRFNSNHLYTNLGKYDPPEAGSAPVFRTRNSNRGPNRFTPNYGI